MKKDKKKGKENEVRSSEERDDGIHPGMTEGMKVDSSACV